MNTNTNKSVTLKFIVTQVGKNPFTLMHETAANLKDVSLSGLARKTGYALSDALYKYAESSIEAQKKYGKYITAFRPKAVFKIEVAVNGQMCFYALATKGLDAIRLVDGKGNLYPRTLVVDKLQLIANAVESANSFATALSFVAKVETVAKPKPAKKATTKTAVPAN